MKAQEDYPLERLSLSAAGGGGGDKYAECLDDREDLDKLDSLSASKDASNSVCATSLEGVGDMRAILTADIVRENAGAEK